MASLIKINWPVVIKLNPTMVDVSRSIIFMI